MNVLILRHEKESNLTTLINWSNDHGFPYTIKDFSEGREPENHDYDILFICGGDADPDEDDFRLWLKREKHFIREAIHRKKYIIGLCLGAQLVAQMLDGKVFKSHHFEFGWHPVQFEGGGELTVFQWHQYQFTTPSGAFKIAGNEACPHQAFSMGKNILAFQFHAEAAQEWISKSMEKDDLPEENKFSQAPKQIIALIENQIPMHKWFIEQLDQLVRH